MGISRLKRLLIEDLSRAFTTNELKNFIKTIYPSINLYSLTGYPKNSPIPRKEAATQVINFFQKQNKLHVVLNLFITTIQKGFKGEKVVFNNVKFILQEMTECGYQYRKDLNKVLIATHDNNGWGYLETGKIYNFCFASIDIAKNSKLVRKYDATLIQKTYKNFKKIITKIVETYQGRIWNWEGDGGLLVFHLHDFVRSAVVSCIDILAVMPIFNAIHNYLDEDINIRIGIHAGNAKYLNNTSNINSDAIIKAKDIEKHHTDPLSISVSQSTFPHIDVNLRTFFVKKEINKEQVYKINLPIRNENEK